jgi:hypothetical protein
MLQGTSRRLARGTGPGRPGQPQAGGAGWAGATPGPETDARGGRPPRRHRHRRRHRCPAKRRGARGGKVRGPSREGLAEGRKKGKGQGRASPSLPGGRRRRGPAVAKENALPGRGRALPTATVAERSQEGCVRAGARSKGRSGALCFAGPTSWVRSRRGLSGDSRLPAPPKLSGPVAGRMARKEASKSVL